MKRFIASLLALAVLATPAFATATITIMIASPTVNTSASNTFTDAEATKIAAYVIGLRHSAIVQTPAILDSLGNVVMPAVMRDPTAVEALGLYFKDWITDLANKVTAAAQAAAAATASGAVVPVTPK